MNHFDETFAFAFNDSLLQIKLNCDKSVNFKYMQISKGRYQKKMLSN